MVFASTLPLQLASSIRPKTYAKRGLANLVLSWAFCYKFNSIVAKP